MNQNAWVRWLVVSICCACGTSDPRSFAQQVGRAPVDVHVPRTPAVATALGRGHLVYELHITNFGASPVTLDRVDVLDGERHALASWSGPQLWQRLSVVGQMNAARRRRASCNQACGRSRSSG